MVLHGCAQTADHLQEFGNFELAAEEFGWVIASPDLQTQLAIAYTDTSDFVVAQGYAEVNAAMYGELFSGGLDAMNEATVDVTSLEGNSPMGTGKTWSDEVADRVMWLQTDGNGHNWPAGSGETGAGLTYVSGNGVNFSYLMAEFFTANALRADGDREPGDSGGAQTDGGSGDSGGDDSSNDTDGSGSSTKTPTDASDDGADSGDSSDADTESTGAQGDTHIEPSGRQCSTRSLGGRHPLLGLALLALASIHRRRR